MIKGAKPRKILLNEKKRSVMGNSGADTGCGCYESAAGKGGSFQSGCMVCGAELVYFEEEREATCVYCGRTLKANAACSRGHFVCDACHRGDALEIIQNVCLNSKESDCVTLMQTIRAHPAFNLHGPEHHSLVPAVILTALRNGGEEIRDEQILAAIRRGETTVGGSCAFNGACGAAIGVGIAVSVLEGATPYAGEKRQLAQQATYRALGKIASYNAGRCCQRDSWLALNEAAAFCMKRWGRI